MEKQTMSKDNQKVETEYSLLARLTENEAYLYGVIEGKKKRIEQLEGIPISPEILEKCGWVLDFTDKKTGIKSFINYNLDLDAINICTDGKIYYNCWENSKAPMYLHQLQNLYYALTGTELTINF